MNFFRIGSKVPQAPTGGDPDDDLASNAGFEIGVDESPPAQPPVPAPVKGLFGRYRKQPEPVVDQQPTSPTFSVQEVQPSIRVTDIRKSDPACDVSTDEEVDADEEADMTSVTKSTNMAAGAVAATAGAAGSSSSIRDRIRERKLRLESWYHEGDRKERIEKAAPYCIIVAILFLLTILLAVVFGLLGKDFSTASSKGIGPASINVMLEFDENPQEIGWKIYELATWEVVKDVPEGTYADATTGFANEEIDLVWGKEYVFRITDAGGDGMSSGNAGQWLFVFRDQEMAQGEGNWGSEDTISFLMNEELGLVNMTGWQKGGPW
jgi:hypothetical protein